jgi:putative glutamine amidotransferase
MTRRPRIAIADIGGGLIERCLKREYAECIERAGAVPEWILGSDDVDDAERLALTRDGFLFPGGSDIDPTLYGQKPSPRCGRLNSRRDRVEPRLLMEALRARKPIFGICRGFQLLDVAMGGTLCQDIETDLPTVANRHFRATRIRGTAHAVAVMEGSLLSRCVGSGKLAVNSVHHQAIATIPDSLLPSAMSDDGVIEGLEAKDYPFALGVQWHPELLAGRRPVQQEIFNAFVRAARETMA